MFATLPGGPSISYFTTLGLNCTILIPAPEFALRSCEANTLCRRVTARAETDRTTTSSSGIQTRLSRPLIDIALTRSPPAARPQCCPRTRQATDPSAVENGRVRAALPRELAFVGHRSRCRVEPLLG